MRSSASGDSALTATRANDGSSLVLPTRNSSTSKSPPSSTTRLNVLRSVSESMRWPSIVTMSCTMAVTLQLGQRQALLGLVLALLVRVRGLTGLVALEEQHLGHALAGIDARGQGRGVGDLQR